MAVLAPCLVTLRSQINKAWPNRDKTSDGWIGDEAHQQRASDHNPGGDGVVEAIDIDHDPANGCDCHKLTETIRLARDPRLEYMIWNHQILYSGGNRPWQWQSYGGTNPHTEHAHFSCQPDAAIYNNPAPWVIERGAAKPGWFTDIVATVFGGPTDTMAGKVTAYGNLIAPNWWDRPGLALPARFSERPLPLVEVEHNGKTAIMPVIDVGPHNINDAYWRTGSRPQAETGFDMGWTGTVRKTNRAGIDLTPAGAAAINLRGKGIVNFRFIKENTVSDDQTTQGPSLTVNNELLAQALGQLLIPLLVSLLTKGGGIQLPPIALPPPVVVPPPPPVEPPPVVTAPPAGGLSSILMGSGTKTGAILGIGLLLLQMSGILPAGALVGVGDPAAVGNTLTTAAAASPVLGAMGLFQWLGKLFK